MTNRVAELVVSDAGMSFPMNDLRLLDGPVVYAYMLDGVPLYVGSSVDGLKRVCSVRHHRVKVRGEADECRIWPCLSVAAARELEGILIEKLKPQYNERLPGRRGAGMLLGLTPRVAQELRRSAWARNK